MCLIINLGQEPEIAEKDIPVYKVIKTLNCGKTWTTPYQDEIVTPGMKAKSIIIIDREEINIALHSFATLEAAKKCSYYYPATRKVIKCIIPKETTYYKGFWDVEDDSYASDKLNYPKFFRKCV